MAAPASSSCFSLLVALLLPCLLLLGLGKRFRFFLLLQAQLAVEAVAHRVQPTGLHRGRHLSPPIIRTMKMLLKQHYTAKNRSI
jgi:hypothetical protein